MPIAEGTRLDALPSIIAANVAAYNIKGTSYNNEYKKYIAARTLGAATNGSLSTWIAGGGAKAIWNLLDAFGMNKQKSRLVPIAQFQSVLSGFDRAVVDWIAGIFLPLNVPPPCIFNTGTGVSLCVGLESIYNALEKRGSVTAAGGYVAASKAMHCLFPGLAPMIDGRHTGVSYFNINRQTYIPPLGLVKWEQWVGSPISGFVNPSPRGAGRQSWQWPQFMAAVGLNQHIYELWQTANGNPGVRAFLAIDATPGKIGIPRLIDKCLW